MKKLKPEHKILLVIVGIIMGFCAATIPTSDSLVSVVVFTICAIIVITIGLLNRISISNKNNTISNSIHVLQTETSDNLICSPNERRVFFLDSNGQVTGTRIAKIGEKVIVETQVIKNAQIKVFANGTEIPCSFSDATHCEYAFIMPNGDVAVSIVATHL